MSVEDEEFGSLRQPAPIPHFQNHPGEIRRSAPRLGEGNDYVYREVLGLASERIDELRAEGIIRRRPSAECSPGKARRLVTEQG